MAHYGTLVGGDAYFAERPNADAWKESPDAVKTAFLNEVTQYFDRLVFRGTRNVSGQALAWPRKNTGVTGVVDDTIPTQIEEAAYEEALSRLRGRNPEREFENLAATSQSMPGVRTTYDRPGGIPPYLAAGITSLLAWAKLMPFLGATRRVKLNRVS